MGLISELVSSRVGNVVFDFSCTRSHRTLNYLLWCLPQVMGCFSAVGEIPIMVVLPGTSQLLVAMQIDHTRSAWR